MLESQLEKWMKFGVVPRFGLGRPKLQAVSGLNGTACETAGSSRIQQAT